VEAAFLLKDGWKSRTGFTAKLTNSKTRRTSERSQGSDMVDPDYIIKITVETDVDPSTLLDIAHQFGAFVKGHTSEECKVDEVEASVDEVRR